jgi:uncharacterized protein YndB with AHSA1/START domain
MPVCEIDLRAGGEYRYVWRSDESGREFGVQGRFREIEAPWRLIHTESMDGRPGEALCTMTLTQHGKRTTLELTMRFDSQADRDAALQSGMTEGMSMSYDRLDESMNEENVQ